MFYGVTNCMPNELEALRARVKELEEESKRGMAWADRVEKLRLETANNLTKSIENNNEQEVTIALMRLTVNQLQARIRELEEAMPDAFRLRVIAGACNELRQHTAEGSLLKMADKIEKVMKR